jgi:SOS-response transcriptional repressor LexA
MTNLLPRSLTTIPIAVSPIAAGPAVEIGEDNYELDINELITGGREGFKAYELTGDSAAPEIHHGNLVFVNSYAAPCPGDIIAARVNGHVCVKRFQPRHPQLYLVSPNKRYAPIEIHETDDFEVLGVYVGHLGMKR